ncbi:phosducin-like 2 [Rhodotorula toruloides]|uniref:Phosducin-like 2 n=1 Tax=Rhodotorula toruloides TaxID=5286 RepID=A0A511KBS3_RHOTO|nr:phosducin-like 2 [Rhodotorula toruloides]
MEQMFLDGTHPALQRNADAAATLRASSPPRSRSSSPARRSDDEGDGSGFTAIDPDPSKGGEMPSRAPGGGKRGQSRNTGVKGVRADYKEAQRAMQNGNGAVNGLAEKVRTQMIVPPDKEEEVDDELAELRRKRLKVLQMQGSGERRGSDAFGNRIFGHLREVGVEGYVNAVEEEDEDVAVVRIQICDLLDTHLAHLARLYPSTKFIRCVASELDFMSSDIDASTLPTVLIYRKGDLEATWVRFDLELPSGEIRDGDRGRKEVEEFLAGAGVISGPPHAPSLYGANGAIRSSRHDGEDDDDDE